MDKQPKCLQLTEAPASTQPRQPSGHLASATNLPSARIRRENRKGSPWVSTSPHLRAHRA